MDTVVTDTVRAGPSFDVDRVRGARVLLVEDKKIHQLVALGRLEDTEFSVDLAENGEIAVRKVHDNDYDLVLMDVQMPVIDRSRPPRIIRSDPRFRSLPIIAMTASAMAADRDCAWKQAWTIISPSPSIPIICSSVLLRWIARDGNSDIKTAPKGEPTSTRHPFDCGN